jgi:preprotein translocase subunit SecY
MLATLATVPNFIESTLSITSLNGLSTTSLLILAGVVLDLVREVKNIYYSMSITICINKIKIITKEFKMKVRPSVKKNV